MLEFQTEEEIAQRKVNHEEAQKRSYMAPETVLLGEQTCMSDIFSAGCILAECITRKPLFH